MAVDGCWVGGKKPAIQRGQFFPESLLKRFCHVCAAKPLPRISAIGNAWGNLIHLGSILDQRGKVANRDLNGRAGQGDPNENQE